MTIYEAKIDWLIAGIQAKDVQAIVDKETYIPTLGKVNNVAQVTNWLNKRVGYLDNAKTLTQQQLDTFVDNYYNGLTTHEQEIADELKIGNEYIGSMTEEEWENTVLFTIYYFITTE